MSTKSSIEWTEQTWNPITGCTKVSPGCKHCYAEVMARRLKAMGVRCYENGFELQLLPERLDQPLRRRKPTTYFVNSMSDLFHEDVPDEFITKIFNVIRQTPQHQYQILTKRADRLSAYFQIHESPPANAWLGVSVEDMKYGVPRIEHLRHIPAHIRFLSIEPLLEELGDLDLTGIHWVIVGGESGAKARPVQKQWVEKIKHQCERQNVAFFFKQWGTWGADGKRRSKRANGRILHGKTWEALPNFVGHDRSHV